MPSTTRSSQLNFAFWFHLLLTLIAWFGPFLFDWRLMCIAYLIVQLQFGLLGRCVLNKEHGLDESDDYTFYAYLFETLGIRVRRRPLRRFVRRYSNWLFAAVAVLWQVVLGHAPLIF